MTSVLSVEVAPDLKTAKVFISVLGDEAAKKSTHDGLKSASSFLRGQLAKTLNLRNTPELTFYIDNSIEYGVHMSKLIEQVHETDRSHEAERAANMQDNENYDGKDYGKADYSDEASDDDDNDDGDDGDFDENDGYDLDKEEDD